MSSICAASNVAPVTDPWNSETRRALMSRVRTRDTAPELALRRALWAAGIRGWRLQAKDLPGRPDLIFRRARLAVFVDGAFWHGHPDYYKGQSGPWWDAKITRNRERDQLVNRALSDLGWMALRFWDFEIEQDPAKCADSVVTALKQSTGGPNMRSAGVRSGR